MDLGIKDRVAVVTGAASGMGLATVEFLLKAGVSVMMTDIGAEDLEAAADELKGVGALSTFAVDLTAPDAAGKLAAATQESFGSADILVHAAGITGATGDFLTLSDEDWSSAISNNLLTAVRMCRTFIPAMREKKWGRIVLFASEDGEQPYIDDLPYCACKAAVMNLAKGLSKAYGSDGVTINSILPAFVATPMTDKMMKKRADERKIGFDEAVATFLEEERPGIVVKRRGQPQEIASAVAYLCSQHASYVNGAAIRVDGGSVQTV